VKSNLPIEGPAATTSNQATEKSEQQEEVQPGGGGSTKNEWPKGSAELDQQTGKKGLSKKTRGVRKKGRRGMSDRGRSVP